MAMSKAGNDVSVQGTNDCSILSKHAMCTAGYMKDDYLRAFTLRKAPRRAPLINRGYYIRMKAIDTVMDCFLRYNGKKQILSLGAGFDTLYFRLHDRLSDLQSLHIVEVDFCEVAQRKTKLIMSNNETRECLSISRDKSCDPNIQILTESYCLIGADLSKLDELKRVLDANPYLDREIPTLVLSECVMTYMEHELSTNLIRFIQGHLTNSLFVTYEQIKPYDAFGIFMRSHFDKLNSSLKAITTYGSIDKQKARYEKCGYKQVIGFSMLDFYKSLPSTEKERIAHLEFFDEYEEWHQKCSHYSLILSRDPEHFAYMNEFLEKYISKVEGEITTIDALDNCIQPQVTCDGAQQFAHASTLCKLSESQQLLVIHGGFGVIDGRHTRIPETKVYRIDSTGSSFTRLTVSNNLALPCRLHHTFTTLSNNMMFVFGGRLSPAKAFSDPVLMAIDQDSRGDASLSIKPCTESNYLLVKRWRHSAAYFSHNGSDCVLLSGGITVDESCSSRKILSLCEVFNATSGSWTEVASLPIPCHSHSSCFDGNKYVYVSGGINSQEEVTTISYRMDITAKKPIWEELVLNLLPVYSHQLFIISSKLLIVGGVGANGQQEGLQIYDINTGNRVDYNLPVHLANDLTMYFNHTSHIDLKESLLILFMVGGGGNCFSFGTHINNHIPLFFLQL